jgi:hypothetical protein
MHMCLRKLRRTAGVGVEVTWGSSWNGRQRSAGLYLTFLRWQLQLNWTW